MRGGVLRQDQGGVREAPGVGARPGFRAGFGSRRSGQCVTGGRFGLAPLYNGTHAAQHPFAEPQPAAHAPVLYTSPSRACGAKNANATVSCPRAHSNCGAYAGGGTHRNLPEQVTHIHTVARRRATRRGRSGYIRAWWRAFESLGIAEPYAHQVQAADAAHAGLDAALAASAARYSGRQGRMRLNVLRWAARLRARRSRRAPAAAGT